MQEILKAITPQIIFIAALYFLVTALVALDLWSGMRKARHAGEYRSSQGLRRTVEKLVKYFNMLLVLTCIDLIQMLACYSINVQSGKHIPILTIFTVLGCIFVGFIELKSVYESNEDKDKAKMQGAAKLLKTLLQDEKGKEMLKEIGKYIKE